MSKHRLLNTTQKINVPCLQAHQTPQVGRQLRICEGTIAGLVAYLCNNS
jgi:hypothetical protein